MINICICDDDPQITRQLTILLNEYSNSHHISFHVDSYNVSEQLISALSNKKQYQLFILDIIMPGFTGMDIAREIRETDEIAQLIFLTSSPEFAIESYEVRADNYLLKPINPEKLITVLDLTLKKMKTFSMDIFQIKEKGTLKNIPYDSICYFESKRNKLIIHLNTGEELTTYRTISELDETLVERSEFLRVHRSFIINMNFIREISSTEIALIHNIQIPLSKKLVKSVKQAYFDFTEAMFKS